MAQYIDGFVVPVPKKNLADYRKMARLAGKICRELGAWHTSRRWPTT